MIQDLAFLAGGLALFALAALCVPAADRLWGRSCPSTSPSAFWRPYRCLPICWWRCCAPSCS